MRSFVIVFGLLMILFSMIMWVRPRWFIDRVRNSAGKIWLYLLAILIRLTLGFALIAYSDQSRFPVVLQILGVLSISVAALLSVLPRPRFERLVLWVVESFEGWVRIGAFAVFLFGAFLIYAVMPF